MSADVLTHPLDRSEEIIHTIEPAQRTAAKVVGFLYLFTMATAMFSQLYVHGRLIVRGDAVSTARNIAASERLFRIGIASDLITVVGVVILVWALYVVLRPIHRNLALLAAFLRLTENAIAAAAALNAFIALRFLNGTTHYLEVFEKEQLQALSQVFLGMQGSGLGIAFVFLGAGSAVFSYVWLKSCYIPRALALWGIFSSSVMALVTLAVMVFPGLSVLGLTYMAPMFFYEVGLGLWLLVKGLAE
jgi:uncharacterized protein DUF4386